MGSDSKKEALEALKQAVANPGFKAGEGDGLDALKLARRMGASANEIRSALRTGALRALTSCAAAERYKGKSALPRQLKMIARANGSDDGQILEAVAAGRRRAEAIARGRDGTSSVSVASSGVRSTRTPGGVTNWTITVDESGSRFTRAGQRDCVVAVAMPTESQHPDRSRYHAAGQATENRMRVVSECVRYGGIVLGVRADHPVSDARIGWSASVIEVLEWMLAMLPAASDRVLTVKVNVEQRGGVSSGLTPLFLETALAKSVACSRRADSTVRIKGVRFVSKGECRASGYPDVVSNLWFTGEEASLVAAGVPAAHLVTLSQIERDKRKRCRETPSEVSGESWTEAMVSWDESDDAITACALRRLVDVATSDVVAWRRWWTASCRYRDSDAPDAEVYETMVRWLIAHVPADLEFDPDLELAIECSELTAHNHMGRAAADVDERLALAIKRVPGGRLAEQTLGVLTRAVYRTNRFEFDDAHEVLDSGLKRIEHPHLLAPSTWGRALSQRGQLHAMQGRYATAVGLFDKALESFEKIPRPAIRQREQAQTQTYLVHALIDSGTTERAELDDAIDDLVVLLGSTVDELLSSIEPRHRFGVHALVRCAVLRPGVLEPGRVTMERSHWTDGRHHPWPLIRMYRGLLTFGVLPEVARRCFADAVTDARSDDMGPILWFIAEAIAAVGQRVGMHPGPDASRVERVVDLLPATASRARILLDPPSDLSPVDLVSEILPFGFR